MLMQTASQYNWIEILNAPINWKLYVEQAKGFQIENKNCKESFVYKLKKSFHRLKQMGQKLKLHITHI